MEAYGPYIKTLTEGGVVDAAYILSKDGAILATNLPITELGSYQLNNVLVKERDVLLEAIANNGIPKSDTGIHLNNQKYLTMVCENGLIRVKNVFDGLYSN
jgi:hypothetical protein